MGQRIRELFALLSGRARAGLVLTALLLVAERLILAAGAFGLAGRLMVTWAASAGVVVFWVLRGFVRQSVVKETRSKLTMLIAEAALERGADGSFLAGEEADAAVFEGRSAAEQVLVRHLPPLVAEPIAAVALLIVVKPAGGPVLTAMAAVAVAAVLLAVLRNATMKGQRGAWRKYMEVARDTLTSIRAAPELIASGHEGEYLVRLRKSVDDWTGTAARAERNAAVFQRIPFATVVVVAVVLIVRAQGQAQSFDLAQFVRLGIFFPPIAGLMHSVFELVRTAPRLHTLWPVIDAACDGQNGQPSVGSSTDADLTSQSRGGRSTMERSILPCEIRFEGVSFAYGDQRLLQDLSFVWKPGEVLGIVGPNGSGKSTLLKLILGLLEPTEGKILVGGADLRHLDLRAWRREIAYLPQRPYVPEKATVIEAMRLTSPALTEEAAQRSWAEMGGWGQLVHGVGPQQLALRAPFSTLSRGMQQRVLLGRTVARPGALILLDEPDESLDAQTRSNVVQLIQLRQGRSQIGIATHSPPFLGVANVVVDLGGKRP